MGHLKSPSYLHYEFSPKISARIIHVVHPARGCLLLYPNHYRDIYNFHTVDQEEDVVLICDKVNFSSVPETGLMLPTSVIVVDCFKLFLSSKTVLFKLVAISNTACAVSDVSSEFPS